MTLRRKLLVLDDDPAIYRYLRRSLPRENYEVAAATSKDMLARMVEWQPDVVLLDLAPTDAKLQIEAIKTRSTAPLIGLVQEQDAQATIAALDAGVDDCITKPFSLDELAAHIRKVLRRNMWWRGETPCFETPRLRIDLVLRRIHRGDRTLPLSGRQFQLLKLLLNADGRVLTHRDLMQAIWGSCDRGSLALLRGVIQDLRRKVEADPRQPLHIVSHSRVGYRFDQSRR